MHFNPIDSLLSMDCFVKFNDTIEYLKEDKWSDFVLKMESSGTKNYVNNI